MRVDNDIQELPLPAQLALPLSADARLRVKIGAMVNGGDILASGTHSADIVAPAAGCVSKVCRLPTTCGDNTLCIVLTQLSPCRPAAIAADTLPQLLKQSGIVGQGGGAFPAWRKWRKNLRWFIANGLETEADARHDAALIAAAADTLPARVLEVAQAFGAQAILAVPENSPLAAHPIIRRLPPQYELGSEHLLIKKLCGLTLPPGAIAADYGVVCFNIATVVAMADAIHHRLPLCTRLLTVHLPDNRIQVVRVPLGITISALRQYVGTDAQAICGGADEQQTVSDEAVISATTAIIRFSKRQAAAAMPCIQCGVCVPACPVGLSPQHLYRLTQDKRSDEMNKHHLSRCIECRRCDTVCPSHIALTAAFIAGKKQLTAEENTRQQNEQRRQRYDAHQKRLAQPPPRIGNQTLLSHVAAAMEKANSKS